MFKFNFSVENESTQSKSDLQKNEETSQTNDHDCLAEQVKTEIVSFEDLKRSIESISAKEAHFKKLYLTSSEDKPGSCIEYIDSYTVKIDNDKEGLTSLLDTHDLVPNRYEGGLKVWELSIDLAKFIYNVTLLDIDLFKANIKKFPDNLAQIESIKNTIQSFGDISTRNLEFRILELGCGHALPSLSLIKSIQEYLNKQTPKGCRFQLKIIIYLQDFNQQIIENITFENVQRFLANFSISPNISLEFKFVYGDWSVMFKKSLLPDNYFNVILTSETIYNRNNYKHLLNLFKLCLLTETNSLVLLSAKSYYFGCGGNLLEFLNVARLDPYNFESSKNLLFNCTSKSCLTFVSELDLEKASKSNEANEADNFDSIAKEIVRIHFS
jgi:hypothetical protein